MLHFWDTRRMVADRLPGRVLDGILTTRVAISCFGEEVAPCFDTARRFRYWTIARGEAVNYRELAAEGSEGISRIKLLKRMNVDVLICNGISERLREMLEVDGCVVIEGVMGSATDALFGLLAGQIEPRLEKPTLKPDQIQPHTADLVAWTEDLFRKLDWEVQRVRQDDLFPIDLLAERRCPLCGRVVRAAICCGAHAYRIEKEIQELKRVTALGYSASVYVHHKMPGVSAVCHDFGIQLLDPGDFADGESLSHHSVLPPLRGMIAGHDVLNQLKMNQENP